MRLDGEKRPLGEREEEEKEREAASVRMNMWNVLTDPLHGIYGMVLTFGVSGVSGCPEYPDKGPKYPAHHEQYFSEGQDWILIEVSRDARGSLSLRLANNQQWEQ
jgi:hypothetical protein